MLKFYFEVLSMLLKVPSPGHSGKIVLFFDFRGSGILYFSNSKLNYNLRDYN
jgi:hypothetical protein